MALVLLFARSVTFWMGAWLYTMLMKQFGAVAAVAVTTARKALTVMASFIFFPGDKPLTVKYTAAMFLFFGAVFTEYAKAHRKGVAGSIPGGGGGGGGVGGGGGGGSIPPASPRDPK